MLDLGHEGVLLSTMAVADEKLEPAGHAKVEQTDQHASQETSHLVFNLPHEWFSQKMTPIQKRERMVTRLSDWSKRRAMTPALLVKLMQGPLAPEEVSKYSSNHIARVVYAIGLVKKTNRLIGDSDRIHALVRLLIKEATDRKRLITYDGPALAQTAFGFSMMQLDDTRVFLPFAEEAVKPHRIRNTHGKCLVNLLDAFRLGGYKHKEQVQLLSQAAVEWLPNLPTFAVPKLLLAWGHFGYTHEEHVHATLAEALKENRLNVLLASHIEEILTACAKLKFKEPKIVTLFVRELIYSQKWKFMGQRSLPRIVWALGELQYEQSTHWQQILSAALDPDRVAALEASALMDVYAGWSRVGFRDSCLLDQLGIEATKENRIAEYSTRQLFEIYKAQKRLGQVRTVYTEPVIQKLRDTEKLLRCNLETAIKLFLFPGIKKTLGMRNVASLAKKIFQPASLSRWDAKVLMCLAKALVPLGPRFNVCFAEIAKELSKEERLHSLKTSAVCELLSAWGKLEFQHESLERFAEECVRTERLSGLTEQELLKLSWLFVDVGTDEIRTQIKPLFLEAMSRPLSKYTGKGLTMFISCSSRGQCMESSELEPAIQEVMKEDRAKELTPPQLKMLHSAFDTLGCEKQLNELNEFIQSAGIEES